MRKAISLTIRLMVVVFLLLIYNQSVAQNTYTTRQGFIVINTYKQDSMKSYSFKNILVILDYEKSTVDLSFRLDDNQDNILASSPFSPEYDVRITTRLSIPKLETQPHPDRNFHTTGELLFDQNAYDMKGHGELSHHEGSEKLSCYLMLKLVPLEGTDLYISPLGEIKELHLFQTVLSLN
ncbi:MAG: hypothetical protein RID25_15500 [Cyclobacteriaceae bacterium]